MARHRRISSDVSEPDSKQSSGILSHVFNFVSREFESFIVNATGGPVNQPSSKRRVRHSGKRYGCDSDGNLSEDDARSQRTQHHRKREGRFKSDSSRLKPRSKSTDSGRRSRKDHSRPTDGRVAQTSDRERSKSPRPPEPSAFLVSAPSRLKKQPSITMPGSLFPRSSSLMPDPPNGGQCVQTISNAIVPVRPRENHSDEPGSSSTQLSIDRANPDGPSLNQYTSPWRSRPVSSVKDAVSRFNATEGAEADFSLMLPSPHSSPARPTSNARSVDNASPQRPSSNSDVQSSARKSKERTQENENDDDLNFIVHGSADHEGVYAKERELDAAREEQREHERRLSGDQSRRASDERERDKRRIRALEEEVRWLKVELSRSQVRHSPPLSLTTDPPPPPPPPPPFPLRIDTAPCTPTTMFVTARASLRHAMTPVEAPINDPGLGRTKRQGQPTVNVPSEKMAAFLQEIKTAKLRKVGSGLNAMGGDGVAGPSGLSRSVNVTSSTARSHVTLSAKELLRRRSLANLRVPIESSLAAPVPLSILAASLREPETRAGQKRKADDVLDLGEANGAQSKRRMTEASFQSSSAASQRTAASSSETSMSGFSFPSGQLQTNETDVTTPSLCSDNDRDENSIEDRIPSTPPGPRTTAPAQKVSEPSTQGEQIEVIDVDMEERLLPESGAISHSVPHRPSNLFKKRPPVSPIPNPTPRRPSAPARTRRGATPRPKSIPSLESDVDDENHMPAPVPFISLIPAPKPKSKMKTKPTLAGKGRPRTVPQKPNSQSSPSSNSGSSAQSKGKKNRKRRQTLDEELRIAEACSSDIDQCNDELEPQEEEDVFTATGTMSTRRGFLAHGGGGGTPVFMGVGCVEGAMDSGDEEEAQHPPKPTGRSLIPRPKARS